MPRSMYILHISCPAGEGWRVINVHTRHIARLATPFGLKGFWPRGWHGPVGWRGEGEREGRMQIANDMGHMGVAFRSAVGRCVFLQCRCLHSLSDWFAEVLNTSGWWVVGGRWWVHGRITGWRMKDEGWRIKDEGWKKIQPSRECREGQDRSAIHQAIMIPMRCSSRVAPCSTHRATTHSAATTHSVATTH